LQCCPNLVDLSCQTLKTFIRGRWHPVELRALRSLDINIDHFLSYLTAPRLERLLIRCISRSMEAAINALPAFIAFSLHP
jgi:hypothetical protein